MKISCLGKSLSIILLIALVFSLCSCGNDTEKYVGIYVSTKADTLILDEDGTCIYTEADRNKSKTGNWILEDGKITVKNVFRYDIYAKIINDSTSLLFQADNSKWNDELFVKS